MIRLILWLFQVERLMRRLDRRPSPIARRLAPINPKHLAIHVHGASIEPPPITRSPFL